MKPEAQVHSKFQDGGRNTKCVVNFGDYYDRSLSVSQIPRQLETNSSGCTDVFGVSLSVILTDMSYNVTVYRK